MMYALISAPNHPIALGLLLAVTGFLLNLGHGFSRPSVGSTTKETYPLAVSVVNTGGQAGGAVFPFITGLILDDFMECRVRLPVCHVPRVADHRTLFAASPPKGNRRSPATAS